MGGGLMQLVAYGAQDIYLTGNPQITFFKVVYRRHTNFSMESIQQTWAGTFAQDSGAGRCTATIARNGDLVNRLYIEFNSAATSTSGIFYTNTCHNGPAQWINTVECEIGGQTIDRQTGAWMEGFTSYSIKTIKNYLLKKKYKLKEIRFKLPKNIGKFKGDPVRTISRILQGYGRLIFNKANLIFEFYTLIISKK